jgi:hypothetical protein
MRGKHDRRESDEEMRASIRMIMGAEVRFRSMEDLQEPVEGSILARERPLTSRYPIDAIAVAHQVRAVDNLQQVFGLMVDEENFEMKAYPYTLYSLIRTTIEAAATALWVLQSSRKSTRVFRGLQLAYRDVRTSSSSTCTSSTRNGLRV